MTGFDMDALSRSVKCLVYELLSFIVDRVQFSYDSSLNCFIFLDTLYLQEIIIAGETFYLKVEQKAHLHSFSLKIVCLLLKKKKLIHILGYLYLMK